MIKKLISMAALLVTALFASSSFAYNCSGVPQYSNSASYNTGAIVQNNNNAYQCSVGGWCTVGGPYEPGVGWAWQHAWSDLGSCSGGGSSSGGSSSGGSSSGGSSSGGSSSGGSSSGGSSSGGGSCAGLPVWSSSQVYTGGDRVQYQGTEYRAKWWTQGENPSQSGQWGVWANEGSCGGSSSSSGGSSSGGSSSGGSSSGGSSSGGSSSGGQRVIGYATSWSGSAGAIDYSRLTHINYAFLPQPNNNGTIQGVPNAGKLQSIVSSAHANGVKVMISVGGWTDLQNGGFESTAANASYRTTFTNAMVNLVNQYNLDGVDIDWEYPQPGAQGDNYTLLMSQLADAMHARGKLLTAAVVALGYTGGGVQSAVFNKVDFLNLMAYDGGAGATHSPYSYAVDSINYWRGRGLPASKTVLGVPFYARPSWNGYNVKVGQNAANRCRDTDGSDHWNGIPTIRAKGQLARQNGGIMTWEMAQDTTGSDSLLTAMYEAVNGMPGSFGC